MFQWIKALFLSSVRWFKTKTVWVKRRGGDTDSFLRGSFLRPYRTNKAAMDSLPAARTKKPPTNAIIADDPFAETEQKPTAESRQRVVDFIENERKKGMLGGPGPDYFPQKKRGEP
jgi:hypothetical protein